MSATQFKKGPQLFSMARKKAMALGIPLEKGVKLEELIKRIQEKEGNSSCFRQRDTCEQTACCWQASCRAKMVEVQGETQ